MEGHNSSQRKVWFALMLTSSLLTICAGATTSDIFYFCHTYGYIDTAAHPSGVIQTNESRDRGCFFVLTKLPRYAWVGLFIDEFTTTSERTYVNIRNIKNPRISQNLYGNINVGYFERWIIDPYYYKDPSDGDNRLSFQLVNPTPDTDISMTYRVAYAIQGSGQRELIDTSTRMRGYIVSHEDFDYGTNRTTGLYSKSSRRLGLTIPESSRVDVTIHYFDLYPSASHCESSDHLMVSNVKGYEQNALRLCGDNANLPETLSLYPSETSMVFDFTSISELGATGFLLEYSVVSSVCDPGFIKNAKVTHEAVEWYTMTCSKGYRALYSQEIQNITCSEDEWDAFVPCTVDPGTKLASKSDHRGQMSDTLVAVTSAGVVLGLAIIIILIVIVYMNRRRRRREREAGLMVTNNNNGEDGGTVAPAQSAYGGVGKIYEAVDGVPDIVSDTSHTPPTDRATTASLSPNSAFDLTDDAAAEYGNSATISENRQEGTIADVYAPILASQKKPKENAMGMKENELYGT